MTDIFVTLFDNTPAKGGEPSFKIYLKIDGVEQEIAVRAVTPATDLCPRYKGYLKLDGGSHEFWLRPSKNGNGFTGKAKLKGESKYTPTAHDAAKANAYQPAQADDQIPF